MGALHWFLGLDATDKLFVVMLAVAILAVTHALIFRDDRGS